MSENSRSKHVIILGAGASASSGYPVATKLRLLMSSQDALREELEKRGIKDTGYLARILKEMMGGHLAGAIDLFRHGGFASVDEFSNMAGSRFHGEVQTLKRLLRFALALNDPEEQFHKSDYYSFIQKLFQKGLFPLRDDISILTFNYDGYLPYVLAKANSIRCQALGVMEPANTVDALRSGFAFRNTGPLETENGMCLLQLHGAIAWPGVFQGESAVWERDLYGKTIQSRVEKLVFDNAGKRIPPVLFPWEVIDSEGNFMDEVKFCLPEQSDSNGRRQGGYAGPNNLYQLFTSIWKRARKEITAATKISFVGLSMHGFLEPAFKFLFQEKENNAEIIVANTDLVHFIKDTDFKRPANPATKVRKLLEDVWVKRLIEKGILALRIRTQESFEDFIKYEME
jgi:hypothetical protein